MTDKHRMELLCSRIFHDLASPISGVNAGIELLSLSQGSTPEIELLKESAVVVMARLNFFRHACGNVTKPLTAGHVEKISRASFPELDIIYDHPKDIEVDARHILILIAAISEERMGKLSIQIKSWNPVELHISGKSNTMTDPKFNGLFGTMYLELLSSQGHEPVLYNTRSELHIWSKTLSAA